MPGAVIGGVLGAAGAITVPAFLGSLSPVIYGAALYGALGLIYQSRRQPQRRQPDPRTTDVRSPISPARWVLGTARARATLAYLHARDTTTILYSDGVDPPSSARPHIYPSTEDPMIFVSANRRVGSGTGIYAIYLPIWTEYPSKYWYETALNVRRKIRGGTDLAGMRRRYPRARVYGERPKSRRRLADESTSTLDMILMLSEGPCQLVDDSLWVDGQRVAMSYLREWEPDRGLSYWPRTHRSGRIPQMRRGSAQVGRLQLAAGYAYDSTTTFARDRYQENLLLDTFPAGTVWGAPEDLATAGWTDDHRLDGICSMRAQLINSTGGGRSATQKNVWKRIPNLQPLVRGMRITWPGQTTPRWTRNAAAIRHWREVHLRGRDPATICIACFHEAHRISGRSVPTPDAYAGRVWLDKAPPFLVHRDGRVTWSQLDVQGPIYEARFRAGQRVPGGAWWISDQRSGRIAPPAGYLVQAGETAAAFYRQPLVQDLRYAIDGILESTDDPDEVDRQMDAAWQGWAVEQDGMLHFRPGAVRAPVGEISDSIIERVGDFRPQPPLQDRFNAATVSVASDSNRDWEAADLPQVEDPHAVARDGQLLPRDLGSWTFVDGAGRAHRLRSQLLRRVQHLATLAYTVDPGDRYERYSWIPTDRVLLSDSELGFTRHPFAIIFRKIEDDGGLTLVLEEQPDSVHADTSAIPPISLRPLAAPLPVYRPAPPAALSASTRETVAADGTLSLSIAASWTPSSHPVVVRATGPDGFTGSATSDRPPVEIAVREPGLYVLTAASLATDGSESARTEIAHRVSLSVAAVASPSLLSVSVTPPTISMTFSRPAERDIAGLEIRYRFKALGSSDAFPAWSDSDWDGLALLETAPVVPVPDEGIMTATSTAPRSGRYELHGRWTLRSGRQSATVPIGEFLIAIPGRAADTVEYHPGWPGTALNLAPFTDRRLLVFDPPDARALSRRAWNGQDGWPFGARTSVSYFVGAAVTAATEHEDKVTVEVRLSYDLYEPPDPAIAPDAGGNVILRCWGGPGDGTFPVQMDGLRPGVWTRFVQAGGSLYPLRQLRGRIRLLSAFQGAGISSFKLEYRRVS